MDLEHLPSCPAWRKPWVPSLAAHKLGIVLHTVMFRHSCTAEVEAGRSGVPGSVKYKSSLSSMIPTSERSSRLSSTTHYVRGKLGLYEPLSEEKKKGLARWLSEMV